VGYCKKLLFLSEDIAMPLNPARLRQARNEKGLSLDELARRTRISKNQLFRYEKGLNDPASSLLAILALELGVSADFLLGLTDDIKGYLGDALTSDEEQMLSAYRTGDTRAIFEIVADRLRRQPK
jgi:transcriptional regulator with XRE-family HTH domain